MERSLGREHKALASKLNCRCFLFDGDTPDHTAIISDRFTGYILQRGRRGCQSVRELQNVYQRAEEDRGDGRAPVVVIPDDQAAGGGLAVISVEDLQRLDLDLLPRLGVEEITASPITSCG